MNERIEGEHHYAVERDASEWGDDARWSIHRKGDDAIVEVSPFEHEARNVMRTFDEAARHFIEQGIQTERNRSKSDGADGAAELLRELSEACDGVDEAAHYYDETKASDRMSVAVDRHRRARVAAKNYLATQPDTPAEEPPCAGPFVEMWECKKCGSRYTGDVGTCGSLADRSCTPTDPEGGPYRKGDTHEDVGIPLRGLWDGRNPDPLTDWELELVNAAYAAALTQATEGGGDA